RAADRPERPLMSDNPFDWNAPPNPDDAPLPAGWHRTGRELILYREPNRKGQILGELPVGTVMRCLGPKRANGSDWMEIGLPDGRTGFFCLGRVKPFPVRLVLFAVGIPLAIVGALIYVAVANQTSPIPPPRTTPEIVLAPGSTRTFQ